MNLVELDGQYGGRALVALAEHMFRTASTRLRTGRYPAGLKQDLAATVAELGEVSGWLAFDDGQYKNAKMCNIAALHHARAAGDTDMALFVLGNMALQAQETGRLREGLRIVELMEQHPLSPRLRVLVAIRRARLAADLGDASAFQLIRRAQADATDSVRPSDPAWSWWVDEREALIHAGGIWRALGRPDRAVDCYTSALDAVPTGYRWASYIGFANLVTSLVDARSWSAATAAVEHMSALVSDVSSMRAQQRLQRAARTARRLHAPSSLEDALVALAR